MRIKPALHQTSKLELSVLFHEARTSRFCITPTAMYQNEIPPEHVPYSKDLFSRNYPSHAWNLYLICHSFLKFGYFGSSRLWIIYLRLIACIPSLISPSVQENKIKLEKTKKLKFMILLKMLKMNWIWTKSEPRDSRR